MRRPPDGVRRVVSCSRTTQPFGGNGRFVLFTNGHAAAQVTLHGYPKTPRRTNKDSTVDPDAWLSGTETDQGTWWTDAAGWHNEYCGAHNPAPPDCDGPGPAHHGRCARRRRFDN